jgi:hypothetical protein
VGLFISERIRKREFGSQIPADDKASLLAGARPELAQPIAGKSLPKGTRLLKTYATTKQGPRRILYLLVVEGGDLFVLFYRDKNDLVGENMSPKNAAFNNQLSKHLDLLREDILKDRVEQILPGG